MAMLSETSSRASKISPTNSDYVPSVVEPKTDGTNTPTRPRFSFILGEQFAAETTLENRCHSRNRRVRVTIAILLGAFILCSLANMALSIACVFVPVPYWTSNRVSSVLEIILLVVSRLVMLFASVFCAATFMSALLWYKVEPPLHLANFMPREDFPSVDILLPRYKEDWDLFGPTVQAALALDYPRRKLLVHVLDDGSRTAPLLKQLRPLMRQHSNLRYITRPNGKDAKAGNLNNALSLTSNPLIVVFDADHRCKPDFLLRAVPHLLSVVDGRRMPWLCDSTAFVQTTQAFYNERLPLVRMLDGSHSLFYQLMMPSYNGMGCAMCVGTGYVMQRAALESVGGYVCGCAVEDVVTGLAMHKRGWRSKYLECRLVEGLSPKTLSEFFTQRERWVAGSAQLLLYRFSIVRDDLPMKYRLAYMAGSSYWLMMLVIMILVLVRLIMWFAFRSINDKPTTTWVPLLSEYVPVYAMFLLLPVLSLGAKIASITAMFSFFPTYLSVLWGWLLGRLNPTRNTFRVKGAAEAFGDSWPRLANLNLAFLVVITLIFGASIIPAFHMYMVPLDWAVPGLVVAWCYIVNFPVIYDVCRRILVSCIQACRSLRSAASKTPHTEPPTHSEVPI
jgi:cellulose synthase (UDP-forming)